MAFLLETLGGGDFFLSFLGDDGGKRPTPQQKARATAVKSRENEIRQDMAKFFKKMKEEMSDAFKKIPLNRGFTLYLPSLNRESTV